MLLLTFGKVCLVMTKSVLGHVEHNDQYRNLTTPMCAQLASIEPESNRHTAATLHGTQ